jgi:hypothetical protein
MTKYLCVSLGIYILIDALYLAAKSNEEKRYCTLAKYTCALMSGIYFIVGAANDERLLFALTIALFMWPETYYRLIACVQLRAPKLYINFIKYVNFSDRRKPR